MDYYLEEGPLLLRFAKETRLLPSFSIARSTAKEDQNN